MIHKEILNNMNPLVSIVVPVYNVSDYIERCLSSIIEQTYKNIECIIVDDATPDDSIEKCERFIAAYDGPIKFRIVHHEKNGGLSAARNTGTNTASGDYLYYLDSDDDISSDCIEKLSSFVIEDNSIQMVQGNHLTISDNKEEPGKSVDFHIKNNDDARDCFLNKRWIVEFLVNKLLKKDFIVDNQLFNREGLINEDLIWMFYVIKYLKSAYLCNDVTYFYRMRSGSIATSSSSQKQGHSYAVIYDEILHNLSKGKEKGELNGLLYNFSYNYAAYVKYAPELKPVFTLYKKQAREYGCWYAFNLLSFVGITSRFFNLSSLFQRLNKIRRKLIA